MKACECVLLFPAILIAGCSEDRDKNLEDLGHNEARQKNIRVNLDERSDRRIRVSIKNTDSIPYLVSTDFSFFLEEPSEGFDVMFKSLPQGSFTFYQIEANQTREFEVDFQPKKGSFVYELGGQEVFVGEKDRVHLSVLIRAGSFEQEVAFMFEEVFALKEPLVGHRLGRSALRELKKEFSGDLDSLPPPE